MSALVTEGADHDLPSDIDPFPDALLDRVPAQHDLSDSAAKNILGSKRAWRDNAYYARYVIPYVLALQEGKTETQAVTAAAAAIARGQRDRDRRMDGLSTDRGTVKNAITEAKRRGLDRAAKEIIEADDEITPRTVVARSQGNRIVYPSPEAKEMLQASGIEMPEGGWVGWEEPLNERREQ